MLFSLAVRNVFRHRIRSIMTIGAIAFGVACVVVSGGFIADVFFQLGEAIVHSQTGHIQVSRQDEAPDSVDSDEATLFDLPKNLIDNVTQIPDVTMVAPRVLLKGLVSNGHRDLPVTGEGIVPSAEESFGSALRISAGRSLLDDDTFGIMVGDGLAKNLGVSVGDHINLIASSHAGAMNFLEFEVIGLFNSFSKEFDARAVRINIAAARDLLASERINTVVIGLRETSATQTVLNRIEPMLDGTQLVARSWDNLSDFYEKSVALYERQFGVLQIIILFMVLLSVANSISMSIFERQGELGTMRAIGNKSRDLFKLMMLEGATLGVIGATTGIFLGMLLAVILSAIGIEMPPPPNSSIGYTAQISVIPQAIVVAWFIGFIATVLAAIFPARRTTHDTIVDSLRQNI